MKKVIRKMAGLFVISLGCIALGCLVGWCRKSGITLCQPIFMYFG